MVEDSTLASGTVAHGTTVTFTTSVRATHGTTVSYITTSVRAAA